MATKRIYGFLFIYFLIHTASSGHSLQYYHTAVFSSGHGLPEYISVGYVDGIEITRYSSDTGQTRPVAPWMEKVEDPRYWEKETQNGKHAENVNKLNVAIAMRRFNQTGGFHPFQEMYGCELRDDGSTRGYWQYGFDGKDFLALDPEQWVYYHLTDQAQLSAQKWNSPEVRAVERAKDYLKTECIDWLKKYLEYGKEELERRVRPEVKVSGRRSDGVTKLHCQVYGFYPRDVNVNWKKNGMDIPSDEAEQILPNTDGTFQIRVTVAVTPEDGASYACHVDHSSLNEPLIVMWDPKTNDKKYSQSFIISVSIVTVAILVLAAAAAAAAVLFIRWKRKRSGNKNINHTSHNNNEKSLNLSDDEDVSHTKRPWDASHTKSPWDASRTKSPWDASRTKSPWDARHASRTKSPWDARHASRTKSPWDARHSSRTKSPWDARHARSIKSPWEAEDVSLTKISSDTAYGSHTKSMSDAGYSSHTESPFNAEDNTESLWHVEHVSHVKNPWDAEHVSHIESSRYAEDYTESLWDAEDYTESLWDAEDYTESLWDAKHDAESLWDTEDYTESLWDTEDYTESLWDAEYVSYRKRRWSFDNIDDWREKPEEISLQNYRLVTEDGYTVTLSCPQTMNQRLSFSLNTDCRLDNFDRSEGTLGM